MFMTLIAASALLLKVYNPPIAASNGGCMNRQREYQDKYHHALDRMFDLFKFGREREVELECALALARDELVRIQCCPDVNPEIAGLCKRGLEGSEV